MVEYAYETVGFPILEISSDSLWVKIICNCHDSIGDMKGWIRRNSEREVLKLWQEIIPEMGLLFFLEKENITFYSSPNDDSALSIVLFDMDVHWPDRTISREPSYILYPLRVQGQWMEVDVETPPVYIYSSEKLKQLYGIDKPSKYRVWIRYLDDNGRPLVYYFARGC